MNSHKLMQLAIVISLGWFSSNSTQAEDCGAYSALYSLNETIKKDAPKKFELLRTGTYEADYTVPRSGKLIPAMVMDIRISEKSSLFPGSRS